MPISEDDINVSLIISREVFKRFKIYCIQNNRSQRDVATEVFEKFVNKVCKKSEIK